MYTHDYLFIESTDFMIMLIPLIANSHTVLLTVAEAVRIACIRGGFLFESMRGSLEDFKFNVVCQCTF